MAIKRRKYKSLIAKILVFSVLALSAVPNFSGNIYAEGKADTSFRLDSLSYYNLIVFGDCRVTNSTIEGGLAVENDLTILPEYEGNTEIGSFLSKGADADKVLIGDKKTYEKHDSPSLLVGGNIVNNSKGYSKVINAWNSERFPIYLNDTLNKEVLKNEGNYFLNNNCKNNIISNTSEEIKKSFEDMKDLTISFADYCGGLVGKEKVADFNLLINSTWQNTNVPINSVDEETMIVKLPGDDNTPLTIRGGTIPNIIGEGKNKKIILVSDAEEINFAGGGWKYNGVDIAFESGNKTIKDLGGNIAWVFPKAKKLSKNGISILGSVIAPNANFDSKGSDIAGQVIVNTLHQYDGGKYLGLANYFPIIVKPQNKTILYGDKVDLKDLIKPLKLYDKNTHKYTLTKQVDKKDVVVCSGTLKSTENNTSVEFNGTTELCPRETTNYKFNIVNNEGETKTVDIIVNVLKPQIKINKIINNSDVDKDSFWGTKIIESIKNSVTLAPVESVYSNTGNSKNDGNLPMESGNIFSFNLTQKYGGNSPTLFINDQEWNADVKAVDSVEKINDQTGVTLKNITRGTYVFNERSTGGYEYKGATLNGIGFSAKGGKFEIGLSPDGKVTLNNNKLEGESPVIPITVTNEKETTDFFHSNDVLRNLFGD